MAAIGFANAPVTLLLTALTILTSFFFGAASDLLAFDIEALYRWEVWRIFTSQCVFHNMAQTAIGVLLLYICRHFERQLGSKKYGSFVILSFVVSLGFHFAFTSIAHAVNLPFIPAHGPFFLIFSLLPLFYRYIPRLQSTDYSLLGIAFSEKSWTYLLGAQLMFSQGFDSVFPAVVGLLFGFAYVKNVLFLQQFRIPPFMESGLAVLGSLLLALIPVSTTAAAPRARNNNQLPQQGQRWNDDDGYAPQAQFAPTREPTEVEINAITALGFDRQAALQALRNTDNNVEAAVNLLLR